MNKENIMNAIMVAEAEMKESQDAEEKLWLAYAILLHRYNLGRTK